MIKFKSLSDRFGIAVIKHRNVAELLWHGMNVAEPQYNPEIHGYLMYLQEGDEDVLDSVCIESVKYYNGVYLVYELINNSCINTYMVPKMEWVPMTLIRTLNEWVQHDSP